MLAQHTILIFDERVTKSFWDATAFFKAIKSIDDRGFSKRENQGVEAKPNRSFINRFYANFVEP